MQWLSIVWTMIAAASALVAGIHGHVWSRLRDARGNGAFMLCAASVSMIAVVELGMIRSQTPEEYGRMLWLYHFPVWLGVLGCVLFVRFHLRAGRAWLGWTVVALRAGTVVLNAFSDPNLNYRRILSIEHVSLLGDSVAVPHGEANPWMFISALSTLLLALFVGDAAVAVWRRGDRRLALGVGGLLAFFVLAAMAASSLSVWGIARTPVLLTLYFVPVLIAMGATVSGNLIRAADLAAQLQRKDVELRESEARLALAAEVAQVGLWRVELPSGGMWSTRRAAEVVGLDPWRSTDFEQRLRLVHPDDRHRVRAALETASNGFQASVEYRVHRSDGQERWFSSLGAGEPAAPGGQVVVTGATIDITDRRRAALEAVRQRFDIERLSRLETLGGFASAMAHELSQPLAIMMTNAEAALLLLEREAPNLDEVGAILDDIIVADGRAAEVIARLRSLFRHGVPERHPLAANRLVQDVLDSLGSDLDARGVTLEIDLASGLPDVSGDRVPLEQVILNLVRNACEAMSATPAGQRRLSVETRALAGSVWVAVHDRGSGLPEPAERVFERFFTTKSHGLGVGLAISRSIVEAHGGRLEAEPRADGGATFRFCLPILSPKSGPDEAAP